MKRVGILVFPGISSRMQTAISTTLLLSSFCWLSAATSCPSSSSGKGTKPLYLLTLVPFDRNVGVVSGARIARDEVNNRPDLLPGYHLELITERKEPCSVSRGTLGLSNLLRFAVNPPCRPLIAVSGLSCSSQIELLSPIAGHDGIDLIQLSAANSLRLQTENDRFPHLWTLLGPATGYSDAVLSMMEQFNWTRVGIVYNSGSVFAAENANYLVRNLTASQGKRVLFNIGVLGTNRIYFDHIISNIVSEVSTILIVILDPVQDAMLLSRVLEKEFVYPQYTWIHVESNPQWLLNEEVLNQTDVYSGIHGHIFLFPHRQNDSLVLVSGEKYSDLQRKFAEDLEQLLVTTNRRDLFLHVDFGSYIYDQVWSLALALNESLPILNERNLSIDNYTIGQSDITKIIEDQMANLSFQGAGGWVKFDKFRSVSTPVNVFWMIDNSGTQKRVGIYNSSNPKAFRVNLNANSLPKDNLEPEYSLILLPIAIVMYTLTGVVTIFTTIQLVLFLFLHFKGDKSIKATSPYLSLLMFVGCYLLLLASVAVITNATFFPIISMNEVLQIALYCADVLPTLNGIN